MLTPFQEQLAHLFLGMPEAQDFALAGGSALVFHGAVTRETHDLDFLAPVPQQIPVAVRRFTELLSRAGLKYVIIRSSPSFARLQVQEPGAQPVLVDVGYDYRLMDAGQSRLGPVLRVEELSAGKLLALFGRAEARDFVDVFALASRFGIDAMISWARQKDPGFDPHVLATMIGPLDRLARQEFAVDEQTFTDLQAFFADLRARLIDECFNGS